jgi:hypothetical protein
MNREHGNLDRKKRKKSPEDQGLRIHPELELVPVENAETTARLHEQIEQRDKHQQRTGKGIEEELDRRINTIRSSPDTNDDEQGIRDASKNT